MIDTRRVKVPMRNGKSVINQQNKNELSIERPIPNVSSSVPPNRIPSTPPQPSTSQIPTAKSQLSIPSSSNPQTPTAPPDYRMLLAWSYYLASQAAWLSPMLQQQGQLPSSLPTDPEAAAKFLQQAMQTVMEPLKTTATSNNNDEQTDDELESETNDTLFTIKEEANEL
jgi:hypothetical protein